MVRYVPTKAGQFPRAARGAASTARPPDREQVVPARGRFFRKAERGLERDEPAP